MVLQGYLLHNLPFYSNTVLITHKGSIVMNKKEISLLAGLVFTVAFSIVTQQLAEAQTIADNTLRLHIIANSDSEYDQSTKLAVRDKILAMDSLFAASHSFEQAVENTKNSLTLIEGQINSFLADTGADYTAQCSLQEYYFDTTQYTDFALPQGSYTALTVKLGDAQGKNWWCVLYPALCSSAFGQAAAQNSSDFILTQKPVARFKVVEMFEDIKNFFTSQQAPHYTNG